MIKFFPHRFSPRGTIITLTFVLMTVIPTLTNAETYYVDNTDSLANDANPGTSDYPWRTIHKANNAVKAGDTVIVRAGVYHDWICPKDSGDADNWIVYKSEIEHQAILDGMVELDSVIENDSNWVRDYSYDGNVWKIKLISNAFCEAWKDSVRMPFPFPYPCDSLEFSPGLSFVDSNAYLYVWLEESNDTPFNHHWQITLKSGIWLPFFSKTKYVEVNGFVIRNYGLAGISVQRNHVRIINNISYNNGRAGIGVSFCNYVLVQGNEAYHNCTGIGYSQGITAYGVTGHNIIFRGNISHDNLDGADATHCGTDGAGFLLDTSEPNGGAIFVNNVAYGNQGSGFGVFKSNYGYFINNTSFGNGLKSPWVSEFHVISMTDGNSNNLIFRNNIFVAQPGDYYVGSIKYPYNSPPDNVFFDHNLYYSPGMDSTSDIIEMTIMGADTTLRLNLEEFQQFSFPSDTGFIPLPWGENSIVAHPRLIDWENGGFKLESSSPAIDNGDSTRAPKVDFYNTSRPQGSWFDIGAYEYYEENGVEQTDVPTNFDLSIYPNPFNGLAHIQYTLPQKSDVTLLIYDLLGRQIVKLLEENLSPGKHFIVWNANNEKNGSIASGVYIVLLKANEVSLSRKIIYLK